MICVPLTEMSQIGQARSVAAKLARDLGFNETDEGKVALVATEIATNLVKHATSGLLLIHGLTQAESNTIELLALDKGPGMTNVAQCLRDGYSTAGSPGTGLGAILRTASLFDIYSVSGAGTAILARINGGWGLGAGGWKKKEARSPLNSDSQSSLISNPQSLNPNPQPLEVGVVCLPKPNEEACGDAWAVDQRSGRCLLMVADGLGHGPDAAKAAQEAVRVFHTHSAQEPAEIMTATHAALRATRGAAVAVTGIECTKQQVRFCGVGNITGTIITASGNRGAVSYDGIVGDKARKIQEFIYPWVTPALMVMASDGLATRWSIDAYPGLNMRHPSLIAGVLYRDFSRGRDDVTVVVTKED